MRTKELIYIAFTAVLATCCMAMDHAPAMDNMNQGAFIVGNVTDTSDVAIEHIKVTLNWNDGAFIETQYTNSDGAFHAGIWNTEVEFNRSLTVLLEDIDGEENGGSFESHTETFTVFEGNTTVELDFRLNRATASESSPQS